jgi:response regulator RpfG family c-di-GMP phosphodiesterase
MKTMRKSILTIDDSKPVSYVLATIFKNDFDVYSANNYSEAFSYLRSGQLVDLIIINIPDEHSENFMFLAHLCSSSLYNYIPVAVLSVSNDSRFRNKLKALGTSLFFSTPFDPIRLSEKVKELISDKESKRFIKETA